MRRYSILALFGLVGEDDTDAQPTHTEKTEKTEKTEAYSDTATDSQIDYLIKLAGELTLSQLGALIDDERMLNSKLTAKIKDLRSSLKKVNKKRMSEILQILTKKQGQSEENQNEPNDIIDEF